MLPFDPNSDQTKNVSDLFVVIAIIMGLVVLMVVGLVIYCIVKFGRRDPNDRTEPKQVTGNAGLEIFWTATPFALLIILFIPTIIVMGNADPSAYGDKNSQPDLEIIGHQWWWEYRFPKDNFVTANELHLPVGAKITARMSSGDVIHGFWVPQLAPQKDVNPGQVNEILLQSDKTGLFYGACSEYCGGSHAWMLAKVLVQPQAQYDEWVNTQKQPAPTPTAADALHGQQVFLNNTCVSCHAINGTTAKAVVAPNLTHLGSRMTLGTGVVTNTTENLTHWVRNVQDIKPGVHMPGYPQMSDNDLRDLVTYLEGLK